MWFYYSGAKPVSIPVGNRNVVSVRPHTYVEIADVATGSAEVQRLLAKKLLRSSGMPRHLKGIKRAKVAPVADPRPEIIAPFVNTEFATSIVENTSEILPKDPMEDARTVTDLVLASTGESDDAKFDLNGEGVVKRRNKKRDRSDQ